MRTPTLRLTTCGVLGLYIVVKYAQFPAAVSSGTAAPPLAEYRLTTASGDQGASDEPAQPRYPASHEIRTPQSASSSAYPGPQNADSTRPRA